MAIGYDQDPLWLTPPKAIEACRAAFGLDEGGARRRLVRLAADDFIRTWCLRFVRRVFDEYSLDPGESYDEDEIVAPFWDDYDRHGTEADWKNGSFAAATSFKEVRVYGVRFSGRDLANHKRKLDGLPPLIAVPLTDIVGPAAEAIGRGIAKTGELERLIAAPPFDPPPPDDPMRRALQEEMDGFRRKMFEGLGPAPEPRTKPTKATRKARNDSPVTPTEFDAWFALESPEAQALGYRDVLLNAKRHFKRPVARKLAEGIARNRKPGRKPRR